MRETLGKRGWTCSQMLCPGFKYRLMRAEGQDQTCSDMCVAAVYTFQTNYFWRERSCLVFLGPRYCIIKYNNFLFVLSTHTQKPYFYLALETYWEIKENLSILKTNKNVFEKNSLISSCQCEHYARDLDQLEVLQLPKNNICTS